MTKRLRQLPQVMGRGLRDGAGIGLLSLFFVAGAVFGASAGGTLSASGTAGGFFAGLWVLSWPCLLTVLLASSLFGFLLLPALFFLRGYVLSAGVAALLVSGVPYLRLLAAWGLPCAFSTAVLFFLGEEALAASLSLCRLCIGPGGERYSFISGGRLLWALGLLSAAAAIRLLLLPQLF